MERIGSINSEIFEENEVFVNEDSIFEGINDIEDLNELSRQSV